MNLPLDKRYISNFSMRNLVIKSKVYPSVRIDPTRTVCLHDKSMDPDRKKAKYNTLEMTMEI